MQASERIDDAKVADKLADLAVDLAGGGRGRAATAPPGRCSSTSATRSASPRPSTCLDASGGGEGQSHRDDLEALLQVADLHPDPAGFDALAARGPERPPDDDGVTLSTIHRVKGREWPRVVVFGASEG